MSRGPALARGDIVLVSFPFTDLSGQKIRPTLIVGRPDSDEFVFAFITSQIRSDAAASTNRAEHRLDTSLSEFSAMGLRAPSIVRLDKLATLHRRVVRRRIGRIGRETQSAVASCLRYVFEL